MVKWQYAIDKKIPMFWSGDPGEFPEGCTVFLSSLNKKYFKLTLPNYRKNIEEMKIVRFWLEQLFRCSFRKSSFYFIFNSEMIKILFQNNKNIPLKFNIQEFYRIFFHDSIGVWADGVHDFLNLYNLIINVKYPVFRVLDNSTQDNSAPKLYLFY
ncbi:F-box domain-containing protein [Meloidogyne graminicola]|uniref:F-box domain-containing protein n=1 Tax=Meloidogyne graminicola TaxID=189291 RepID=A0A8S9ZIQ8_9BILA|nr:F-box domain-containing protein [Meloidogyne graminicola]